MRHIRESILILVISIILGAVSAAATIYITTKGPWGKIRNGPWETSLQTGSTKAGMYSRAKVALFGTLALDPSEVIYFIAFDDSEGESLSYRCDYSIEGGDFDARWWSLAVYRDFFFIPTEIGRYSYSSTTTARDPDGRWAIKLSSDLQERNWLPLGEEDGRINLNFRLYNPEPSVVENLGNIDLPKIIREGCR